MAILDASFDISKRSTMPEWHQLDLSITMPGKQESTRERSGSVVECLTRDRGASGSSLTGVTALWSLSKTQLS